MIVRRNKLVDIFGKGILLIFTDLHGNYEDYLRTKEIYKKVCSKNKNVYLVYNGDYVHPLYSKDGSEQILDDLINEKVENVICLLGNHNHSHVGGPDVYKDGINQTKEFESKTTNLDKYKNFFRSLPLMVRTENGIVISHSGPINFDFKLKNIENAKYDNPDNEVLEQILWTRDYSKSYMENFFKNVSDEKIKAKILVTGHTPISEGYRKINKYQIILSTGFYTDVYYKTYLKIDLEKEYNNVNELREGKELLKLY